MLDFASRAGPLVRYAQHDRLRRDNIHIITFIVSLHRGSHHSRRMTSAGFTFIISLILCHVVINSSPDTANSIKTP